MKKIKKKKFMKILKDFSLSNQNLKKENVCRTYLDKGCVHLMYEDGESQFEYGYFRWESLEKKANFYIAINQFAHIVKQLIINHETEIYVTALNQNFNDVGYWKNDREHDVYQNYKEYFSKNKIYQLDVPDNIELIDFILETVILGFVDVDILLPNTKIILFTDVHFEVAITGDLAVDFGHEAEKLINEFGYEKVYIDFHENDQSSKAERED